MKLNANKMTNKHRGRLCVKLKNPDNLQGLKLHCGPFIWIQGPMDPDYFILKSVI